VGTMLASSLPPLAGPLRRTPRQLTRAAASYGSPLAQEMEDTAVPHLRPTPYQREALLLLAEGTPIAHVADVLQLTVGAVYSRCRRFYARASIPAAGAEKWLATHRRCCVWAIGPPC
jgi:DNA-directed RNA polymerase specialized sigma24 family protein